MAIQDYYTDLTARTVYTVEDGMGGTVTKLGEPRAFRGYIAKPTSAQEYRAGQQGIDLKGRLFADADAPVGRYDVIEGGGGLFQVHGAPRDAAGRGHHVEADLVEWRWS